MIGRGVDGERVGDGWVGSGDDGCWRLPLLSASYCFAVTWRWCGIELSCVTVPTDFAVVRLVSRLSGYLIDWLRIWSICVNTSERSF